MDESNADLIQANNADRQKALGARRLHDEMVRYSERELTNANLRHMRKSIEFYCMCDSPDFVEDYRQNYELPYPINHIFKERVRAILELPSPSDEAMNKYPVLQRLNDDGYSLIQSIECGFKHLMEYSTDDDIVLKTRYVVDMLDRLGCEMGVAGRYPNVSDYVIDVLEYASGQAEDCRCSELREAKSDAGVHMSEEEEKRLAAFMTDPMVRKLQILACLRPSCVRWIEACQTISEGLSQIKVPDADQELWHFRLGLGMVLLANRSPVRERLDRPFGADRDCSRFDVREIDGVKKPVFILEDKSALGYIDPHAVNRLVDAWRSVLEEVRRVHRLLSDSAEGDRVCGALVDRINQEVGVCIENLDDDRWKELWGKYGSPLRGMVVSRPSWLGKIPIAGGECFNLSFFRRTALLFVEGSEYLLEETFRRLWPAVAHEFESHGKSDEYRRLWLRCAEELSPDFMSRYKDECKQLEKHIKSVHELASGLLDGCLEGKDAIRVCREIDDLLYMYSWEHLKGTSWLVFNGYYRREMAQYGFPEFDGGWRESVKCEWDRLFDVVGQLVGEANSANLHFGFVPLFSRFVKAFIPLAQVDVLEEEEYCASFEAFKKDLREAVKGVIATCARKKREMRATGLRMKGIEKIGVQAQGGKDKFLLIESGYAGSNDVVERVENLDLPREEVSVKYPSEEEALTDRKYVCAPKGIDSQQKNRVHDAGRMGGDDGGLSNEPRKCDEESCEASVVETKSGVGSRGEFDEMVCRLVGDVFHDFLTAARNVQLWVAEKIRLPLDEEAVILDNVNEVCFAFRRDRDVPLDAYIEYVNRRYSGILEQLADEGKDSETSVRFCRVCRLMQSAIEISLQKGDGSVFASGCLKEGFRLLCDVDGEISEAERSRMMTSMRQVVIALRKLASRLGFGGAGDISWVRFVGACRPLKDGSIEEALKKVFFDEIDETVIYNPTAARNYVMVFALMSEWFERLRPIGRFLRGIKIGEFLREDVLVAQFKTLRKVFQGVDVSTLRSGQPCLSAFGMLVPAIGEELCLIRRERKAAQVVEERLARSPEEVCKAEDELRSLSRERRDLKARLAEVVRRMDGGEMPCTEDVTEGIATLFKRAILLGEECRIDGMMNAADDGSEAHVGISEIKDNGRLKSKGGNMSNGHGAKGKSKAKGCVSSFTLVNRDGGYLSAEKDSTEIKWKLSGTSKELICQLGQGEAWTFIDFLRKQGELYCLKSYYKSLEDALRKRKENNKDAGNGKTCVDCFLEDVVSQDEKGKQYQHSDVPEWWKIYGGRPKNNHKLLKVTLKNFEPNLI